MASTVFVSSFAESEFDFTAFSFEECISQFLSTLHSFFAFSYSTFFSFSASKSLNCFSTAFSSHFK
jgi:hypothetical protein